MLIFISFFITIINVYNHSLDMDEYLLYNRYLMAIMAIMLVQD